jgi:hypothetical protein
MVMVWPTALGQEHQLVIKTPMGPWPQPIVVSISQTGTAILKGSYGVYWSPLLVLPIIVQSGLPRENLEHDYGTNKWVIHLHWLQY